MRNLSVSMAHPLLLPVQCRKQKGRVSGLLAADELPHALAVAGTDPHKSISGRIPSKVKENRNGNECKSQFHLHLVALLLRHGYGC
ncbi:hypothetical protein EDD64_10127 [Effusibacillus lacus]|nr:hypothetical protein EDD64_10127 [Effusibacillus lacus]